MASNRDQQEVVLVITDATAHGEDFQEVLLVLGPTLTISNPARGRTPSQLWIIT